MEIVTYYHILIVSHNLEYFIHKYFIILQVSFKMNKKLFYALIFAMATLVVTPFGESGDEAPSEAEPEGEPGTNGGYLATGTSSFSICFVIIMAAFQWGQQNM